MKEEREFNKNIKRIRRALLGSLPTRLIRRGIEKALEGMARNPRIPYGVKRSLASAVRESAMAEKESIPDGVRAFYLLSQPSSVPVHLHQNEWDGVEYNVWEELSRFDKKEYCAVFFPGITFPSFGDDPSLNPTDTDESERFRLDDIVEEVIWKNVLYEEPIFRNVERWNRPGLSDKRRFENVPYQVSVPQTVRVPFFKTESLADANAQARGIIQAYKPHQEAIKLLIERLKTDPRVRKEFLNARDSEFDNAQLLMKHGLPIDILPHVRDRTDATYEGVPYTIYMVNGGSKSGENELRYLGFVHGIRFPAFSKVDGLTEREQGIAGSTLGLIFKYALYSEPYFRPEGVIIDNPAPLLRDNKCDEAMIAQISGIPNGIVVPFVQTYDRRRAQEDIETTIRAYNRNRGSLHEIVEKLRTDSGMLGKIKKRLGGLAVESLSDSVAEVLGEYGARFIVENPYHLKRKKDLEDSISEESLARVDKLMGRI